MEPSFPNRVSKSISSLDQVARRTREEDKEKKTMMGEEEEGEKHWRGIESCAPSSLFLVGRSSIVF